MASLLDRNSLAEWQFQLIALYWAINVVAHCVRVLCIYRVCVCVCVVCVFVYSYRGEGIIFQWVSIYTGCWREERGDAGREREWRGGSGDSLPWGHFPFSNETVRVGPPLEEEALRTQNSVCVYRLLAPLCLPADKYYSS